MKMRCSILSISLLLISCSKNIESIKLRTDEVFKEKKVIKAANPAEGPLSAVSATHYKDSLFVFAGDFDGKIHKIDSLNKKYTSISREGDGPGEYKKPNVVTVVNKELYFNNFANSKVVKLDFDGNYISDYTLNFVSGGYKFCVDSRGNEYYLYNNNAMEYSVIDQQGNKYFKIRDCFKKNITIVPMEPFEYNQKIYFMNALESKVFVIDTQTKRESVIELKGIKGMINWESRYDESINQQMMAKILKNDISTMPSKLSRFIYKNRLYFLVLMYDNVVRKMDYMLFGEDGYPIVTFPVEEYVFMDTYNDKMIFYKIDKSNYGITNIIISKISDKLVEALDR